MLFSALEGCSVSVREFSQLQMTGNLTNSSLNTQHMIFFLKKKKDKQQNTKKSYAATLLGDPGFSYLSSLASLVYCLLSLCLFLHGRQKAAMFQTFHVPGREE